MNGSTKQFIVASVPAAIVGIWSLGDRVAQGAAGTIGTWPLAAFERLEISLAGAGHPLASFGLGSLFFVPLLTCSLVTSRIWAEVFARLRGRPLDDGWLLTGWLYTLLLPATLPLPFAVVGLSFGVLFGCHVFGGSARAIVNPALLGLVFLTIAYPTLVSETRWLPGSDLPTTWAFIAANGAEEGVANGATWLSSLLGREVGALGSPSALACLLGAAYLAARKAISAGIIAAALIGILVTSQLVGDLPWHWHLVLGNFAFALAFVATDPATRPRTPLGCWAFGGLFGALVVIFRMADPDHPEGALSALLLGSLCIPLLDYAALAGRARFFVAEPTRNGR